MADEILDIAQVEFDQANARRRTERSSHLIRKSLEKYGPLRSLVGQRLPDGRIIVRAGNGTLEEAGQIGIDKVRVISRRPDELVVVVAEDLDETQWKQYAIADNRSGELSDWDAETLMATHDQIDIGDWFLDHELDEFSLEETEAKAVDPSDARTALKRKATQVKLVLHIEEVGTLEAAIAATGLSNRAEAVTAIAQSYLDNQPDASN